jgi:hypothetical protein
MIGRASFLFFLPTPKTLLLHISEVQELGKDGRLDNFFYINFVFCSTVGNGKDYSSRNGQNRPISCPIVVRFSCLFRSSGQGSKNFNPKKLF